MTVDDQCPSLRRQRLIHTLPEQRMVRMVVVVQKFQAFLQAEFPPQRFQIVGAGVEHAHAAGSHGFPGVVLKPLNVHEQP
jgi:diadenosine tetraphosphate (Ap4A) HIT family hydrolase